MVTATTAAHNFVIGETVIINGATPAFSGTFVITSVPSATTFTYNILTAGNGTAGTQATSVVVQNLTLLNPIQLNSGRVCSPSAVPIRWHLGGVISGGGSIAIQHGQQHNDLVFTAALPR